MRFVPAASSSGKLLVPLSVELSDFSLAFQSLNTISSSFMPSQAAHRRRRQLVRHRSTLGFGYSTMMMLSVENNESDSVALGVFDVEEHPVNINATQQRTIRYTW